MVQSVPEAGEGASVGGEASAVACQSERERETFPLSVSKIPSDAGFSLTYTSTGSHKRLRQQVGPIV